MTILGDYLGKIERAFLKDCSDIMVYQIHLESLENCHLHCAILSNGSYQPSWTFVEFYAATVLIFCIFSSLDLFFTF